MDGDVATRMAGKENGDDSRRDLVNLKMTGLLATRLAPHISPSEC